MGKHLNKLKRLDKLTSKYQKATRELLEISKEGARPNKDLRLFAFAFAWLNYQLAIYLLKKFPKAIEADKIDKEFGNIMKNFGKRKRGKK